MSSVFHVFVKFSGASYTDLTSDYMDCRITLGIDGPLKRVAAPGRCEVVLDNVDQAYSPDYASGPHYGYLIPGLPFYVTVVDGGDSATLFTGFTDDWRPDSGTTGKRTCTLIAVDRIDRYDRARLALPLVENVATNTLMTHVINVAERAAVAVNELFCAGQPADNNTVTVNGTVYTFKTTLSTSPAVPGEVLIGATLEASIDNLIAAVNGELGAGTLYATGTVRPAFVIASVLPGYFRVSNFLDPVRMYRLGEAAGVVAADRGSNNVSGAYVGTPTLGTAGAMAGDPDTAVTFDGTDDSMVAPVLALAGRSFSVALWVKPNTRGGVGYHVPLGIFSGWGDGGYVCVIISDDGRVKANYRNLGELVSAAGVITIGGWNLVVLVFDVVSGVTTLYANGVQVATGSVGPFSGADPTIYVGSLNGADLWYTGVVDEVAIYFAALSATQVAEHYAARLQSAGVSFSAVIPGAFGNSLTLAASGANLSAAAANFSGGADASVTMTFDAGVQQVTMAGDLWSKDDTTVSKGLAEITDSEQGLFWVSRAGALIWHNCDYLFKRVVAVPVVKFADDAALVTKVPSKLIFNHVVVNLANRSFGSAGAVVAKGHSVVRLPGRSGSKRWNPAMLFGSNDAGLRLLAGGVKPMLPPPGSRTMVYPFVDPDTGLRCGARNLVLPLVAGTDYTVNELFDGTGTDYTYYTDAMNPRGCLDFSVALTGGQAEVSVVNAALGPLYLMTFQIRGQAVLNLPDLSYMVEDQDSFDDHGFRDLVVRLPLPVSQNFAFSLANYLLSRFKVPATVVSELVVEKETLGVYWLWDVELGDVVEIDESQTGVADQLYMVSGLKYHFSAEGVRQFTFLLKRLDDLTYGILDNATYAKFDTTLRFGL